VADVFSISQGSASRLCSHRRLRCLSGASFVPAPSCPPRARTALRIRRKHRAPQLAPAFSVFYKLGLHTRLDLPNGAH
jgi:hypothetical protein